MTFRSPADDKTETEEGAAFAPRFDGHGLITAVVTDARDGVLLMVAHMNAEALELTLSTGVAHYWSRSRKSLWKKGRHPEIFRLCRKSALTVIRMPYG